MKQRLGGQIVELPPEGQSFGPEQDLHIKTARIGGVEFENTRFSGNKWGGIHISDASTDNTEQADPVDIAVTGHLPQLTLDAEGHAGKMLAGGSIGRVPGHVKVPIYGHSKRPTP